MRTEEILDISTHRRGAETAIIDQHGSTSYAELHHLAGAITTALLKAQVPRHSIVGVSILEARDFLASLFGVLRAGCVAIPISPQLPIAEQQRVIQDTGVSWTIFAYQNSNLLPEERSLEISEAPHLSLRREDGRAPNFEARFPDAAVIRHTSGTTARSKGVVLSHRAVLERTEACASLLEIRETDVVLAPLPLAYHFVASALSFLRAGATIIDCASLSPAAMLELGDRHGATAIYASPLQYELLARAITPHKLSRLHRAISTSALLPSTTANLFQSRFGVRLTQVYGIIEVGLPLWNTDPSDPASSLGHSPLPYECDVVDETRNPVAVGEIGELIVRGPGLFSGYLQGDIQEATGSTRDWFHTGDLVTRDEHGTISYKGRKKSVINCAGNKIFPEEVESILRQHTTIAEARVFAEPHPLLGSLVVAEIVTKPGIDYDATEWRTLCYAQLSAFKVPKEFRVVNHLPTTGSGKLVRHMIDSEEIAA